MNLNSVHLHFYCVIVCSIQLNSGFVSSPRSLIINICLSLNSYMTGEGSISDKNRNSGHPSGGPQSKSIWTNNGSLSGYSGAAYHVTFAISVTFVWSRLQEMRKKLSMCPYNDLPSTYNKVFGFRIRVSVRVIERVRDLRREQGSTMRVVPPL